MCANGYLDGCKICSHLCASSFRTREWYLDESEPSDTSTSDNSVYKNQCCVQLCELLWDLGEKTEGFSRLETGPEPVGKSEL